MIIGIGETILDIIFKNDQPLSATPGGSTFNAMISIGRMGIPAIMVTETGDDHVGDLIVSALRDNGVSAEYVTRHPGTKSHVSLAFLDENNDAQYQFYKDHASASLESHLPEVTSHDIIIFGSFFAVNPVLRPLVRKFITNAHNAGAIIYYDINFRASHIKDIPQIIGNIKENMQLSTIVRGSLEDFSYLYGSNDVDDIYEHHIKPYCPCFICTDGPRPIQLRTPALSTSFPTATVPTVSTIGAGDNFNAGFAYGIYGSSNITRNDFAIGTEELWAPLIHIGQQFSAAVCQSVSNSVEKGFKPIR